MNTNDLEILADSATEGLKDDTELRLDVRQELVSHIKDSAAALREDGLSEEESLAESMKAFGPATDIAAELVSANKSRMRTRQLVRLALRALLVPASLLVAAWIYTDNVTIARTARAVASFSELEADGAEPLRQMYGGKTMPEEAAFLFWGDTSLDNEVARQRSIWEKYPTNKVFYGNYITVLIAGYPSGSTNDLQHLEGELRRGIELDPDNARYNYLLASVMAESAAELEIVEADDGQEDTEVLKVRDRELLDRAMEEMLKGGSKPFLSTYGMEMQATRYASLPPPRSMVEIVARTAHAASILLPDAAGNRALARMAPEYARLLVSEGKTEEAIPYLEAWYPLARKSFEESGALIETLVSFAITGIASSSVEQLRELGEQDRAEEMERLRAGVYAVYENHRSAIRSDDSNLDELVTEHGSILQAMMMPALGDVELTKEDLAPGRQMEQTVIERTWLSGFTLTLLVVMLGLAITSLCLRYTRGGKSAPLLLLPDIAEALRIILFSVVIPLAAFYIYTRYTPFSGRDQSMRMFPRFVVELHVLTVVMLSLAAYFTQKLVAGRCARLGLESPEALNYGTMLAVSLIPLGLIVWVAAGRRRSAMFRGTVARSLIPVIALIVVLVGGATHPYLVEREARLVQSDTVMGVPQEGGFTHVENRVTQQLNERALAVMDEWEATR